MLRRIFIGSGILLFTGVVFAQAYKWVDEDGVVHYSDRPHPGAEITAVQDILGKDVPVAGGYTLGQIVPGSDGGNPQLLNQHIVVIAFSER